MKTISYLNIGSTIYETDEETEMLEALAQGIGIKVYAGEPGGNEDGVEDYEPVKVFVVIKDNKVVYSNYDFELVKAWIEAHQ